MRLICSGGVIINSGKLVSRPLSFETVIMLYEGAIRYLTIRFLKENSRGNSYKSWGEDSWIWYVPSSSVQAAAAHTARSLTGTGTSMLV